MIGTAKVEDADGIVNAVTVGAIVSPPSVTVTVALRLVDTFPAASLAQPYSVLLPEVATVYEAGAVADHPLADDRGAVDDSVTR